MACIYFVVISVMLEFVDINLIGIYSLFALSCVVFFAFIIFQYYIFFLLLMIDISSIKPGKYYEIIPERTEWFNLLEEFSNVFRNIFIVSGSSFILLFLLFSPVNSIQIIFLEKLASYKFLPLLFTWIIILIAIVFMIPFSSYISSSLLRKIHDNLVAQSIKKYNQLYRESSIENKLIYIDVMYRINDHRYALRNSFTWVLPLIVSITNFVSLIISIINDLKELCFLA